MKQIIQIAAVLLGFITLNAMSAETQSTTCHFGKNTRLIEVAYPEGTETPCEVRYTKNGQTSVLWRAQAELGYCEEKAAAFIEKQENWGWQCEQKQSTPKKTENESSKDKQEEQ